MVDIPNYLMGVINQLITGGAPPCGDVDGDIVAYMYSVCNVSSLVDISQIAGSPPETPPCWWPGHIPPPMCYTYTYMLASCHPLPHKIPPCRLHGSLKKICPIQPISICKLLLPIQYLDSSHVLATVNIIIIIIIVIILIIIR